MEKYLMLTLTNAKPGKEQEFERWNDELHIPDLLRLPGVATATRYQVLGKPGPADVPGWDFGLALQIETDSIDETLEAMGKAARTPAMPISDALDPETTVRLLLKPVAEVKAD